MIAMQKRLQKLFAETGAEARADEFAERRSLPRAEVFAEKQCCRSICGNRCR